MAKKMQRMSRAEQAQRRKDISKAVKETGDPLKVARDFKVSMQTVQKACLEFRVKCPPTARGIPSQNTLLIIAELIEGKSLTQLAEKYNLTRQRVLVIKKKAEAAKLLGENAVWRGKN